MSEDGKPASHLSVAYDEDDPQVVELYPTNFRDVPAMLRNLADDIEANEYGAVGEAVCVVMGDSVEVFGWGPDNTGASTAVLLQAGAFKLIDEVKNHTNNTKDRMK